MVYDLEQRRRVKLLRCAEMRSLDVVSLAWSHDSKYILVQGGSPDYQLVYFFWEKGKVITSITRVISQASGGSVGSVSFHPKANLFDKYLVFIFIYLILTSTRISNLNYYVGPGHCLHCWPKCVQDVQTDRGQLETIRLHEG